MVFLLLILWFALLFPSALLSISENKINLLHPKYPHLYISIKSPNSLEPDLRFFLNKHALSSIEKTVITPSNKPPKWIILIDNSANYINRSSIGKRNHLLLELSHYFNREPSSFLFSYLVSDRITPFDMKRESIFSLQPPRVNTSRIIDAIIISNQQIRTKYPEANPIIIIVGSGKINHNIEYDFLPHCPIFYLTPANHTLDHELLRFMIKSSGGSMLTIPETIESELLLQKLSQSYNQPYLYTAQFSIPLLSYRPFNDLEILGSEQSMQIGFPALPLYLLIALPSISAILAFIIFLFLKWAKGLSKRKRERKNQQEFSTAFLKILLNGEHFEIRISSCEFFIGNSKNCDYIIDDFELSATHCMIKERNGNHKIIDLDSRNGVYVNGKKIKQWALQDKDMIEIGNSCLIYQRGSIKYVSKSKIL